MSRPHLRSQTPESLLALWPELGLLPRQARQLISRLVWFDRDDIEGLDGLSRQKAAALIERSDRRRLEVVDCRRSPADSFVKYLFRSGDGTVFESVRIPLELPRWSACVSSQAGCAMACTFCETGRMGFGRNLEPWEIVEQALTIRREGPERPLTGVVFQGQGEPFHNYDNVMRAADILRHPCGLRIGSDRITISTVGLLPEMERYTEERRPFRLILSLTSAFADKRAALVPVGRAHDVRDLALAMRRHAASQRTNLVNIAWVLMSGVNTQPEEARELGLLFRGLRVRLSVIDVNDPTGRFERATDEERRGFFAALAGEGIAIHRRYSGGADMAAACGMLASRSLGGESLPAAGS